MEKTEEKKKYDGPERLEVEDREDARAVVGALFNLSLDFTVVTKANGQTVVTTKTAGLLLIAGCDHTKILRGK